MKSARILSASGLGGVAAILGMTLLSVSTAAQDFYAGKQLNMLVGSAPGGGYDAYARLFACLSAPAASQHQIRFMPGS